jgi:hypothetical protein
MCTIGQVREVVESKQVQEVLLADMQKKEKVRNR